MIFKQGDTIEVRLNAPVGYGKNTESPYPEWHKKYIPLRVLYEYSRFFVVRVRPHEGMMGTVQPYNVTIDKRDLRTELFSWRFASDEKEGA